MSIFSKIRNIFNTKYNSDFNLSKYESSTINDIDSILLKKNYAGLNVGEIILLDWADKKFVNTNYPKYFSFQYGINVKNSIKRLKSKKLLEHGTYITQLNALRIKELKEILRLNNINPKGRKEDLIQLVLNHHIRIPNLPEVWSVTEKGKNFIKKHEYIILSHKEKHIEVTDIITFKDKQTEKLTYDDLIWKYLTEKAIEFSENREFGCLRNTYLQQAEKVEKGNQYLMALSFYVAVILFDASGMDNSLNYKSPVMVNLNDYVFDKAKNIIKKNNISRSVYYEMFEKGLLFFKPHQEYGFLNNVDIQVIKNNLYTFNKQNILTQLKKYME